MRHEQINIITFDIIVEDYTAIAPLTKGPGVAASALRVTELDKKIKTYIHVKHINLLVWK